MSSIMTVPYRRQVQFLLEDTHFIYIYNLNQNKGREKDKVLSIHAAKQYSPKYFLFSKAIKLKLHLYRCHILYIHKFGLCVREIRKLELYDKTIQMLIYNNINSHNS